MRLFKWFRVRVSDTMANRNAYPLAAESYRGLIETLQTDEELRERMPTDARVAIYLMALCGLRIGEATDCVNAWVDVNASGVVVRVPTEASGEGFTPKTRSGSRTVPVPSDMTCHYSGEELDLEFGRVLKAHFVTSESVDISTNRARFWLHQAAKEAGVDRRTVERNYGSGPILVPDVIPHDLRASWCAQALRSDVNRYTIRDWGGWSGMDMINRYAKYVGDPGGEMVDRF